jgi:hypothetical protein
VKAPFEDYRYGGYSFAINLRTKICTECHLADIEFEIPHHTSKGRCNWINFDELEFQARGLQASVDYRLREARTANGDCEGNHRAISAKSHDRVLSCVSPDKDKTALRHDHDLAGRKRVSENTAGEPAVDPKGLAVR